MLSQQTAKMFELINQIGTIHEELRDLYQKTYLISPEMDEEMSEAVYKLQDFWLDRAADVMREHFWTNPNVL